MRTHYLLSFIFILLVFACGNEQARVDAEQPAAETPVAGAAAYLLTQDFPFAANDKNRVDGPYQANAQISVPADLTPQNKWIMFEGPVLENDKVAYRYYADSRHRFDIYGKTVADLVMDTVSWKYHDIMNWGSDILKVGNSLGMGSPAIWYQDSIYTLSDCAEKQIEIIDVGEEKALVRTTFKQLNIAGETFDLVQDWSLEAGNFWSRIDLRVVDGSLPEGMRFATGFVAHLPAVIDGTANGYAYRYNWGKQSFHEEMLGMAILAEAEYGPVPINDALSHVMVFETAGTNVSYRFMAIWERDQSKTRSEEGFAAMVVAATQE